MNQLAFMCQVTPRTFRDWHREKFLASYQALKELSDKFNVVLPKGEILDSYWYVKKGASLGAKKRFEIHGPLGTPEGRMKGGRVSQERRRNNPEKYRALGCKVANEFITPPHSPELAESIGIFLGDGGLGKYQAKISLSALVDREYSKFVAKLLKKVFDTSPSFSERSDDHTITLVVSGIRFVDMLEKFGLKRGDKMRNKIRIPTWISENETYSIACLRGLFDTDGGLYFHKKRNGTYIGWCFSSYSRPLLQDIQEILRRIGLHAKKEQDTKLYLYSLNDVLHYMEVVGSHNVKNMNKFKAHLILRKKRPVAGGVLRMVKEHAWKA